MNHHPRRRWWWDNATLIMLPFLLYLGVAAIVYRFRHPEQTETELLLNTWDAVLWR